jgi:hypothetical protein
MIKVFCDACGAEIPTDHARDKFRRLKGRVGVELLTTVDGVFDGGNVCRPCLLKVMNEGEDVQRFPTKREDGIC